MIWIGMMIGGLLGAAAGVLGVRRMEKKRSDQGIAPYADTVRKTPETVTLRARRDIPLDVWMDRIERTDAKTASAQLQLSMAQQIASEAARHVQVTYCYDPVKQIYEISARMRVVPWRDWE